MKNFKYLLSFAFFLLVASSKHLYGMEHEKETLSHTVPYRQSTSCLHEEAWSRISSFLDDRNFLRVREVCREWRNMASIIWETRALAPHENFEPPLWKARAVESFEYFSPPPSTDIIITLFLYKKETQDKNKQYFRFPSNRPVPILPLDVWDYIVSSFLHDRVLFTVGQVCSEWRNMASDLQERKTFTVGERELNEFNSRMTIEEFCRSVSNSQVTCLDFCPRTVEELSIILQSPTLRRLKITDFTSRMNTREAFTQTDLPDLTYLEARFIQFHATPFIMNKIPNITMLDLSNLRGFSTNDFISLFTSNLTNLKSLNFTNNCLNRLQEQDVATASLPALTDMDLSRNNLQVEGFIALTLASMPNLVHLNVSSNSEELHRALKLHRRLLNMGNKKLEIKH